MTFDLDDYLGDGPTVLAFFQGAFTPPCSNEMVALQDRLDELEEAGATLLGISADSSFSLGAFADEYDLDFELVSDMRSNPTWHHHHSGSHGATQQAGRSSV